MRIVLLAIAIALFLLSAVVAFGWFGVEHTSDTVFNVLGLLGLGSAFFSAAHLPLPPP